MEKYSLMSLNLNFYNPKSNIKRTTEDVAEFIINNNPTFVALQEFGEKSITGDIDGLELLNKLNQYGYAVVEPLKDGIKPINTRILYLKEKVHYKKMMPPYYEHSFVNRQTGGIFELNGKTLCIYSLHFPLYQSQNQDNREDKMKVWEHTIRLAQNFQKNDYLILAGDFNESLLGNQTALSNNLNILEKYLDSATNNIPTWKNQKLDHIFVSKTLKHKKSDPLAIANNISDHKALLLEFEL
ncbi:endonuclease/exonuclease/phosphatase family protein [Macrococcoides caseolyticum]|uniref:endonuclease/exonuclease/phosphatase family protein n=1 Tax=Macrococcoides caseolyticum TaxID=69966 RepID=UPI001F369CFC|nr:endonuclease/exonuclease/phosphatase family protein [Macrococcus caseolyticus]MCE4956952.1 endonuclease/exonuclease/phosphatase family protein [Macrococcus caseolyticus]